MKRVKVACTVSDIAWKHDKSRKDNVHDIQTTLRSRWSNWITFKLEVSLITLEVSSITTIPFCSSQPLQTRVSIAKGDKRRPLYMYYCMPYKGQEREGGGGGVHSLAVIVSRFLDNIVTLPHPNSSHSAIWAQGYKRTVFTRLYHPHWKSFGHGCKWDYQSIVNRFICLKSCCPLTSMEIKRR